VTHGSANTVVARITSTDDDDIFAPGVDIAAFFELGIKERFGVKLSGR
jgi:hypothetical protein